MSLVNYKLDSTGPKKLDWKTYKLKAQAEYKSLLAKADATEDDMQLFFERNPCFIPGAFGELTQTSHAPLFGALFSQPILPGFKSKVPDFMWIAKNSDYMVPVLIEIEKPSKKYFNSDLSTTAHFNQAQGQIVEWKAWFDNPENHSVFAKTYDFFESPTYQGRAIKPIYILIYGRASEIDSREKREKKGVLARNSEHIMTFDRLAPASNMETLVCVKRKTTGIELITYPPYSPITPNMALDFLHFKKTKKAVTNNPLMDSTRADFIFKRFTYWDSWSSDETIIKGIQGGDEE